MTTFSVISNSAEETSRLGERLGRLAGPGDVIALTGDLGSGKTQFARGVAAGAGVDPAVPITSPTYTLLNIYPGRSQLYHFDLYRLEGAADVAELGFEEYLDGDGIAVVEWAERLQELLPEERLAVFFSYEDEHAGELCLSPMADGTRRWWRYC